LYSCEPSASAPAAASARSAIAAAISQAGTSAIAIRVGMAMAENGGTIDRTCAKVLVGALSRKIAPM
jgi:hypothetical protein